MSINKNKDKSTITITQKLYFLKILDTFNMSEEKPNSLPLNY